MKIKFKDLPLFCPFEYNGRWMYVSGNMAFDGKRLVHIDPEEELDVEELIVDFYKNGLKSLNDEANDHLAKDREAVWHMRMLSQYCKERDCDNCKFNGGNHMSLGLCLLYCEIPAKWEKIYARNQRHC